MSLGNLIFSFGPKNGPKMGHFWESALLGRKMIKNDVSGHHFGAKAPKYGPSGPSVRSSAAG